MSAIAHTPSSAAAELNVTDLYNVRAMLSDDERMVQDTVGKYVDDQVIPIIGECFEHERFPRELIPGIAELGLLGSSIEGYGCAGLNGVSYGLICQELERGDSGLRSFVSVQSSLCMYPIYAFGSEEQKQRWLPRMAKGEVIGCFGLTEPHGGSDPANMKTVARKQGKDWVLNGAKMWITNGSIADLAIVWAQTDAGIRGFLVEKGFKGFSADLIKHKMSLRASITSSLFFDNVVVPEENVLPGVIGLKGPLSCLTQARYGITWGVTGAAQACLSQAIEYSKTRQLFGKPLAATQAIQIRLAEMARKITTSQLLSLQLGRLKDQHMMVPTQVSMAKWHNTRSAIEVARDARDILGANGVTDEYQCGRHMLNLESVYTYEGTHDIHTLVVGQDITGIPAFDS